MEQYRTHLLVIPGQNGMGGQNVDTVLPYFTNNNLTYLIPTPLHTPDFGQKICQDYLKNAITELATTDIIRDNDHLILHGSSQGTATTINYVANNPKNIKALILESVLLTGNNAIFHTVDNVMIPQQCDLPQSSYYTLPYTAKCLYPNYSPTGEQPINNIDKLPIDLPIIILHDTKDFQLAFKDAQALYAYLTDVKKNKNVYLFSQESESGKHINLLGKHNVKEITAINTILSLHNLLPRDSQEDCLTQEELQEYQPAPKKEWLDHFNAIFNKEKNLECLDSSLKVTSSSFSLYAAGKWLGII
jgi:hypothetical protein